MYKPTILSAWNRGSPFQTWNNVKFKSLTYSKKKIVIRWNEIILLNIRYIFKPIKFNLFMSFFTNFCILIYIQYIFWSAKKLDNNRLFLDRCNHKWPCFGWQKLQHIKIYNFANMNWIINNWRFRCNNSRGVPPNRNGRGYVALGFVHFKFQRILAPRIPYRS